MRLPLFPLDTVLFPGCILDLQLFEARYLDMISGCLKAGHGFGVVRILQGLEVGPAATAFATVGCEAVIRDWQQQPNGLLGIRVEGQRRFDIEHTEVQADQLIVAQVRWRAEAEEAQLDVRHEDLVVLLEALRQHPLVHSLGMNDAVTGSRALADQLAYLLPFQPEHKIELLQMDDIDARLQRIQGLLERLQDD
nr:LON peptidase substrate-binding domain-containing protein [Pseudomonas sp.]